jgi:hypothetical protein
LNVESLQIFKEIKLINLWKFYGQIDGKTKPKIGNTNKKQLISEIQITVIRCK